MILQKICILFLSNSDILQKKLKYFSMVTDKHLPTK